MPFEPLLLARADHHFPQNSKSRTQIGGSGRNPAENQKSKKKSDRFLKSPVQSSATMAEEILSPNNPLQKQQRLPRIQSPTGNFFLGSNNDQLERAQARAARAAAVRRKHVAGVNGLPPSSASEDAESAHPCCLTKQQILDLFSNCIKLVSENKINQKNTWDLDLIDHLYDIIKVEDEADSETNFQKASCTLEAGVKIYSLRVDSVHSEAYKVLSGIHRVGLDDEPDASSGDPNSEAGKEDGQGKKEKEKKISPLSTLEPSFESINVKKLDVAFAVDPLYHQTSAQFDEGGAKGLLLNNLGVYGGCRVLFDSEEVPGKFVSSENRSGMDESIDLSFAQDCIEQLLLDIQTKDEISPTLSEIICRFDEQNRRPVDTFSSNLRTGDQEEIDDRFSHEDEVDFGGGAFENQESCTYDRDDDYSVVDDGMDNGDTTVPSYHQENEFDSLDMDDRSGTIDTYLLHSLGFASKHNAWAGPDHWKYQRAKGSEDNPIGEEGPQVTTKKPKGKKQAEPDVDFTKALDEELPDVFDPPKNPKSLLLPANRKPCNTKLPEDCHYQPVDLVKLFLLPNVMCIRKRGRRSREEPGHRFDDNEAQPSWNDDDDADFGGQFDDMDAHSDVEHPDTLVSQPRQVAKIDVKYDKSSKQVDVQRLKETLWHHIQDSPQTSVQNQEEEVSFKDLLASFPNDCNAAATINDISPHLCFICLLHLANEHGLSIQGRASLDDLSIHLPHNASRSSPR
ncbi:Condensin complex subunit 2 [Linum perenne]